MASDEPTNSNIQQTVPVEHNIGTVPGVAVVDADGAAVADAGGTTVANKDAMPIAAIDYRRLMPFVSEGLVSWSDHSAPLDMYRASPCPTTPMTTAMNNLAVH
jgi:hypothetical protein